MCGGYRGLFLGTAVTVCSAAVACSVAAPYTVKDAMDAAVASDHVAAVPQAACVLLSFKIYRWSATWLWAPIVLTILFAVHPGLYVSASPSMVVSGDCGLMSVQAAAVLLLAELTILAFQHDAARKAVDAGNQADHSAKGSNLPLP
jgi:hypothetical protein